MSIAAIRHWRTYNAAVYFAPMRIRWPELLERKGLTPYAFSKLSEGRVSLSTVYRLNKSRGRLQRFDAELMSALCDVLDVRPGDLFEQEKAKRKR
jgi:DNA-binding Xre family transcriptional regulator